MAHTDTDRVIALAALLLSTRLVDDIARQGLADAQDCLTCFQSVRQLDAPSAAAIYGGTRSLQRGLYLLQRQFQQPQHDAPAAYAISLLMIERQFRKRTDLQRHIANKINELNAHEADITALTLTESLAKIYAHTLSTLNTRVVVRGSATHLTVPENAQRIRALLLAGLRAAVLWQQSGGSWWQLVWHRRRLLDHTRWLLDHPITE